MLANYILNMKRRYADQGLLLRLPSTGGHDRITIPIIWFVVTSTSDGGKSMRTVRRTMVLASTMLIVAVGLGLAARDYPTQGETIHNEHGDLRWESRATESVAGKYHYYHGVKNLSTERNCRVNWDTPKLLTTIAPSKDGGLSRTSIDPPRQKPIEGVLRYNGGPAAGEDKTDTLAWLPEDGKARETENEAHIAVEIDGTLYPLVIKARSSVEKGKVNGYTVSYELTIEPENSTMGGAISHDVRKLLTLASIEWQSIASTRWSTMPPIEFSYGWIKNGKYVQFDKLGEKKNTFSFKVSLQVVDEPTIRNEAIQFRSIDDDNGPLLAQSVLSAYGFK